MSDPETIFDRELRRLTQREPLSQAIAKSQATDAALSRQVACTDGLEG